MSEEESPDLTKSWVFVDSVKKSLEEDQPPASGVEEVVENDSAEPHGDSDTDSISVISESGCSYKTDEEEFVPATSLESEELLDDNPENPESPESPESPDIEPPEVEIVESLKHDLLTENGGTGKRLYFATSAACAVIVIILSIAIQHYFYGSSDVDNFTSDFDKYSDFSSISHYVQSVKKQEIGGHSKKSFNLKRKSQSNLEESQNKIIKLRNDNSFQDKIAPPNVQIENNDLTVEGDVKSNYKLNKNKNSAAKFNKENCDDTDKRTENVERKKIIKPNSTDDINKNDKKSKKREKLITQEENRPNDEKYNKKLKELKIKEDYLREKEKFLIEKEHHLLKKEIKLNKEKNEKSEFDKNKFEKKTYHKKEKEHKHTSNDYVKGKKDKHKSQKKYSNENTNPKNNRKYKNKEEKKRRYVQNHRKNVEDESHRKRNVSGQWYINLHKARSNIRQKERASDWVFDRAHLRSLKRNKAHWYFQWMVDRARLRVK